ncbi:MULTISPECIES: energy transducer TonB [Deefgea]|uniref:energy transducer TonB n=1 Tax=Deefgea TaxID=400947 RepID=UPI0019451A1E|nr:MULTISPECIES: energy transducer TonB [Deefgea]MBM9888520.1 TonB family protein [Deefgea sp. CFH1-16]
MLIRADLMPPRRRLRGALCCALLLHALLIGAWQGFSLPRVEDTPVASSMAVMLQTAVLAPKAVAQPAPVRERAFPQNAPLKSAVLPAQPQAKVLKQLPVKTVVAQSELQLPASPQTAAADAKPVVVVSASNEATNSSQHAKANTDKEGEGKVTPAQYLPAHLNNPSPVMPYISIKNGESGTVRLWVKVSAKGEPLAVRVEKSSGFPRLDEVAFKTVKEKWRFVPAKRGDTPIESEVAFNIPFVLKDAE